MHNVFLGKNLGKFRVFLFGEILIGGIRLLWHLMKMTLFFFPARSVALRIHHHI